MNTFLLKCWRSSLENSGNMSLANYDEVTLHAARSCPFRGAVRVKSLGYAKPPTGLLGHGRCTPSHKQCHCNGGDARCPKLTIKLGPDLERS